MELNKELVNYIESEVFPIYSKNEIGHGLEHIKSVIERSFRIVEINELDVDLNMVYVVAAYHDIGHHIDSKRHEVISAEMMMEDKKLKEFFNDHELLIIHDAIEDHRASSDTEPRTIYGKIVSSADRNNTVLECLKRTYTYGKKNNPLKDDEFLYNNAYDVLKRKFGVGGYAKFYFKDPTYDKFLEEIRELLEDKDNFIKTQKEYIDSLKEKGEI